jgi:hypothetical protein
MRNFICCLLACVFYFQTYAQDDESKSNSIVLDNNQTLFNSNGKLLVGFEVGYDRNRILTDISGLAFTQYHPRSGYSFGVPMDYKLKTWLSLFSDPNFTRKNYQIARTEFFNGVQESYINSYVQVPVAVRMSVGTGRWRFFFSLGGYVGYWAFGRVKGSEPNILNPLDTAYSTSNPTSIFGINKAHSYNEKYQFSGTRDNRWEFGWLAGLGASYDVNSVCRVFIEARITQSLSDQQKKYMINQVPRYNQTYGLNAGCLLRINELFRVKKESSNY